MPLYKVGDLILCPFWGGDDFGDDTRLYKAVVVFVRSDGQAIRVDFLEGPGAPYPGWNLSYPNVYGYGLIRPYKKSVNAVIEAYLTDNMLHSVAIKELKDAFTQL